MRAQQPLAAHGLGRHLPSPHARGGARPSGAVAAVGFLSTLSILLVICASGCPYAGSC